MSHEETIILNDSLLVGKGRYKDVYINPNNTTQVVKLNVGGMMDYRREMNYRRSRKWCRLPKSTLMPEYYGSVKTNLGTGHLFERIADYDGERSITIKELIRAEIRSRKEGKPTKDILGTSKAIPPVAEALVPLRDMLIRENVIIHDHSGWTNILLQFTSASAYRLRAVDGFGTPALIPVEYYIESLRKKHIRRRWIDFIKKTEKYYPGFLSEEEKKRLTTF